MQEEVVTKTMKMDYLPLLQDCQAVSGFYCNLLQSQFFQDNCLVLIFNPPWGSFDKELELLHDLYSVENVVCVPYIYQFIPFPLYPSKSDDVEYPLVFEVVGNSFTVHSCLPDDPLHPVCKYNLSLSCDAFITLLYNAVDKQTTACNLPPLCRQSDSELKKQLSLLFSHWKEESTRTITWETPSGTRSVTFSSDIVRETKQRLLFELLSKTFSSLHVSSFSPFVVVGNGDLADFIRVTFPHYIHSPQLLEINTHDILVSNLSRLIIAHMNRIPANSFDRLLPGFRSVLSSAMHHSPHSLGWGECVTSGGETILHSEEKDDCIELCLCRRDEEGSPCVQLTVNRCLRETFTSQGSCYVDGVVPHYFATNGDMTKEVDSHVSLGVLENGQLSGPCLVAYGEKGLVFEGEMAGGRRNGYGEVTCHGQRVFAGEFEKDRITGRGMCVKPDGTEFIGSFADGELHGVGCEMVCGEEVTCGMFVHGEWEGLHVLSTPQCCSAGVVNEERWNGPVVRSMADGSVMLSHYDEGVLTKEALWCDTAGAVVNAYLTDRRCVQVRYGPEGKKVAMTDYLPKPHNVTELDDLWLLGDGEAGAEEAEVDDDAARLLAELAEMGELGEMAEMGELGEEDAWVMNVEAGLARGEEFGIREGEAVGRVVCNEDNAEEVYEVRRGERFENCAMWRILWKSGGEKGRGEGTLLTEGNDVVYEGGFEDYMFCGNGSLFYKNCQIQYEGTFSKNVLNGKGRWYFPNGCLHYDGMWKDGLMEGDGMLYKPVNLKYTNSAFRLFLQTKGVNSSSISISRDCDIYNME